MVAVRGFGRGWTRDGTERWVTEVRYAFFLGGRDLEMVAIRELLEEVSPAELHDKGLAWGARASAYREEIEAALEAGMTPVLVELADDLGLGERAIRIDHHGSRAGKDRPTSLEQVFRLLGLPRERWTRWLELVAANDRGHVRALEALDATGEEIRRIRAADRAAQGITAEEERQAEAALEQAETCCGGALTVVHLPHNKTAAAADRLEPALGGPGYQNLLLLCPGEASFFGSGELVEALDRAFPGGWKGGELPERGFWGHAKLAPGHLAEVRTLLEREIAARLTKIGSQQQRRTRAAP